MKVFRYFKVDLSDEVKRVPKSISEEYNEKTLKQMGYELIDNKWTLKPTNKREEESRSKGKEPLGSEMPEVEGFKTDVRVFIIQMLDSMQKLHVKVKNAAIRLLFVEKRMREMKKEMI